MTTALWIASGFIALVATAIGVEIWLKRGKRRPLSEMRPNFSHLGQAHTDLGMEAIDLDRVEGGAARNRMAGEVSNSSLGSRNNTAIRAGLAAAQLQRRAGVQQARENAHWERARKVRQLRDRLQTKQQRIRPWDDH